jgi:hypothetical protein
MKKLLPLIAALFFIGCATTNNPQSISGVIVDKEFDEGGTNYYYAAGGLVAVEKPAVWWFTVKTADGKKKSFIVSEELFYLLEVGDQWPQR